MTFLLPDPLFGLFPSTDISFEEQWQEFRKQYPFATRDDLWNLNAHRKSDGVLPNPMHSENWECRKSAYQR